MKTLRAFFKDSRRSQRGSVLSAVLIIVLFLSIISGALMTALSTNFLLSNNLLNRVYTQATVNSAAELGINQLQGIRPNAPCPAPIVTPALNGQTAVANVTTGSCWPTVRESPNFTSLANASKVFNIDGTHAQLQGLNDYIIGNPDGTVYDYRFDPTVSGSPAQLSGSLRWTLRLPGSAVTGPTMVMPDPNDPGQYLDLIPVSGGICSNPVTNCVSVRSDDGSGQLPGQQCAIDAKGGAVVTQPAASPSSNRIAYFSAGSDLVSIDVNQCEPAHTMTIPGNQPVVAGPVARCSGSCSNATDDVYAVVSDSTSSSLVRYTYHGGFTFAQARSLPWGGASGLAMSGSNLSAIAITFKGGGIALVQLAPSGFMSPAVSRLTPPVAKAPYWCTQCGDLVGVGTQGGLYVFDSTLNQFATPAAGSGSISTTPQADSSGQFWYFGADDGYVYEAQVSAGQTVALFANRFGPMAQFGSSVQVGDCKNRAWICLYLGALDTNAYLIPMDAHEAELTACITVAPPKCLTGANPRVWTRVEIGTLTSRQAVHVQGWSYYSP
jgi:hypothetical protein